MQKNAKNTKKRKNTKKSVKRKNAKKAKTIAPAFST